MPRIVVNRDTCVGCGECADICPAHVYVIQDGKSYAASPEECIECCSCVEVCPTDSIDHELC